MSGIETVFLKSSESCVWNMAELVPFPNRAMCFGDGFFETMVFDGLRIRFIDCHHQRAVAAARFFDFLEEQVSIDGVESFLVQHFAGQKLRVRWNLYRAGKGRYAPESDQVVQTLQLIDFQPAPLVRPSAGISETVFLYPLAWSKFKTLNALPYVLAAQERVKRGWDEILLKDHQGKLAEAGASNLFWLSDGIVHTPSLKSGCIDGVGRRVVLEVLKQGRFKIQEGDYHPNHLNLADKVWTSNATGISYLAQLGSRKYSTEPIGVLSEIFEI